MTISNPKLGNGFVIKNADSSLDQEHYFTGYKKHTRLSVRFISGTGGNGWESDDYASSSDDGVVTFFNGNGYTYRISGTLWTEDNILLEQEEDFLNANFLNGAQEVTVKKLAVLSYELSNSLYLQDLGQGPEPLWGSGLSLEYFDYYNHTWSVGFNADQAKMSVLGFTDDGFAKVEFVFSQTSGSNSTTFPLNLKTPTGENALYISLQFGDLFGSPIQTASFRNFRVDFIEPLSDSGVDYFRELDNQNIDFQFLNPSVFGKVE
jgi:DNA-dependent RNA polymerase auxiliary subunit epsilon